MIDHALQPVALVDHVRDRLDVPQFDKAVATKLEVRRVTSFARYAFAHDLVRIVDGHDVFSPSDVGLIRLTGRLGDWATGRHFILSPCRPVALPRDPSSQPKHSVSTRRASPV